MGKLEATVAIVTGGARPDGIGFGIARAFLAEGGRVLVTDIDGSELDRSSRILAETYGADRITGRRLDVTSEQDWTDARDDCVGRFGGLDILVNNAGLSLPGTIASTPLEALRRGMAINFESQFLGMQICADALAARAGGRTGGSAIINNSSMAAYLADPENMPYHVSKAAVRMLTMCGAKEFGPRGIRVNSIHYGPIMTGPMRDALETYAERGQFANAGEALAGISALSPLSITGSIEDAGAIAVFLASGDARFVTGAAFRQDGGCFIHY